METYQTLITQDGSPTLIDPNSGQAMHAVEGALEETLYIYGEAYKRSRQMSAKPEVCIVGLGLGYIELAILAEWLTGYNLDSAPQFHSYESDLELRDNFTRWLTGTPNANLEKVLKLVAAKFGLTARDLKDVALDSYSRFHWQIHGALNLATPVPAQFGLICYDPFSTAANPDLWTEEWLNYFLKNFAGTPCVFSTYAANGRLKRSLAANDFHLDSRPGFKMKRESTLAFRPVSV